MNTVVEIIKTINSINFLYPILAPAVFIVVFLFDREKLSIKFDGVAKFIAFLILIGAIKICAWDGNRIETNPYGMSMANFLIVFLEDAYFVMVPFYITNRINKKALKAIVWIIYSIMFASGHIYQGLLGVAVVSIYPYFISNRFAKKTSFGTVMACHFLWDCFVFSLPKINNLLSLM